MTPKNNHSATNDNDMYAQELYLYISELLGNRVQTLSIKVSDEGIVLSGTCDSYHTKQIAQEAVSKCTSRRIISNLILVRDSPT